MTDDVDAHANHYGFPTIRDGESEADYRRRIAGELRTRGKVIEAQEVLLGRRWDDPANPPFGELGHPLTGAVGYYAQQVEGISYARDPGRAIEDDAVAGALVLNRDPADSALAEAFETFGPEATMDFLDAGRRLRGQS